MPRFKPQCLADLDAAPVPALRLDKPAPNENAGDAIVYDNQLGSTDDADPTTVLGGGSIVIHKLATKASEGQDVARAGDEGVLDQNRPNPFNPHTTIGFSTSQGGHVRLSVFDQQGRLIAVLLDEELPGGRHETHWDGSDAGGRPVASGVYYYRYEGEDAVQSKRMLLVR